MFGLSVTQDLEGAAGGFRFPGVESSHSTWFRSSGVSGKECLGLKGTVIITFSSDCIHSTAHKPYTCGCPECVRHVESMFDGVLLPKLLEKSA